MSEKSKGAAMSKPFTIALIVVAFIAGAFAGIAGFIFITGGSGAPSRDISEVAASNQIVDNPGENSIRYRINPEASEVRFTIHEELRGEPTTVVGKTNQVAGEILVNLENPGASQIGKIVINARTLATDNDFRNRALRSRILKSAEDQFEFIEFTPKQLNGLPETAGVGDEISFQIVGDLTITGVTREVVFNATATLTSEDELTGSASAQARYPDFGLVIPDDVPGVANVTEELALEIDFVASRAQE